MNKRYHQRASDLDKVLADEPRTEADRLREMWDMAGSEVPTDFPDPAAIEKVWQALESVVETRKGEIPAGSSRWRRVTLRSWMAIAATVLVGAAIGLLAFWLRPLVETAAPGERLTVMLPDGSHVELNSGTSLRYARRFGQVRAVYLDGEAFFDVAQEERPFVVHTFNAQVRVLGTRFNVRAWGRSVDPGTTVALEEGRVVLAPSDRPEQVVLLAPGQTHRISAEVHVASPPDSVSVLRALAWRNGDLVFKDEQLGIILEDVERRFAIDLRVAPPALHQTRLNLALRSPADAEIVIRDICVALGLNYRETSNGWEIYARH